MNIAIFYRDFDSNVGDAFDVQALVKEFLSAGHHVSVFCSKNSKNVLTHQGITYYRSDSLSGLLRDLSNTLLKFDVAHLFCGFIPSLVPVSWMLRAGSVPFIYSPFGQLMPRGFEKSTIKKRLYVSLFLRRVLTKAKFVHAISEYEASVVRALGAVATNVAPLAIEGYELDTTKHDEGDRTLITYIGRLDTWHKGLDILLPALGQCRVLLERKDYKVVLAGRATEAEVRHLRRQITNENLDELVEVQVDISEQQKVQLLNKTVLFVHPSRLEGFARAMREAMSLRLPIVTTYDSNMGDWVEAYGVGQASEFSVNGLAAAITRQISNFKSGSGQNYEALVSKLKWKTAAAQLIHAYVT